MHYDSVIRYKHKQCLKFWDSKSKNLNSGEYVKNRFSLLKFEICESKINKCVFFFEKYTL